MTMIMETPILTTQHQVLPTLQARMVVEVYSDEELRSPQAFFYGVTGSHSRRWEIVEVYNQGIKMVSDVVNVPATQSMEQAFDVLNPGFYHTNCKIEIEVMN